MGKDLGGRGYITVTLSREGIEAIAAAVVHQLREEGLPQHADAVKTRFAWKYGQPASMYEVYLTEAETAKYLAGIGVNVAKGTLQQQRISGGGIPFVKLGNRIRYRREDIDAWLSAARSRASTSDTWTK